MAEAQLFTLKQGVRYHGLMVREPLEESGLMGCFKSAHWLTQLGGALVAQIGGEEALRGRFDEGSGVQITAAAGGLTLVAGARPEPEAPLGPLRAVDAALRSLIITQWWNPATFYTGRDDTGHPAADAHDRWLTRLVRQDT